ncbi:MAG: Cas10/Cmr2 second palm domain-containing protein [Candidatus Helarchaeota archaeon]
MEKIYTYIDPLTFKIFRYNATEVDKLRKQLIDYIKCEFELYNNLELHEKLKRVNDSIYHYLDNEDIDNWGKLPSDSRFPGYFSSLSDHTIATASIGVAIALEAFYRGVDFKEDYDSDKIKKILSDKRSFLQVIRFACFMHDIGKYPVKDHDIRSKNLIKSLLDDVNFEDEEIREFIANLVAKHHFGKTYLNDRRPSTKLEWIIALADKVSVQDRVLSSNINLLRENLLDSFKWLKNKEIEENNRKKISLLIDYIENLGNENINSDFINLILPLNQRFYINLNKKLLHTSDIFKLDSPLKISLLICEGKSIQGFIRRSEKRKYLTGASSLVASGFNAIKNEIEQELAKESIIYTSSGSLLAIVPAEILDEIKQKLRKKFDEVIKGGIGLNLPVKERSSFNLYEIKSGPGYAWRSEEGIDRRNFGELYNITINFSEATSKMAWKPQKYDIKHICKLCYINKSIDDEKTMEKVRRELRLKDDENICDLCKQVLYHEKFITDPMFGILFEVKNNDIVFIDGDNRNLEYYSELSPISQILSKFKEIIRTQILKNKELLKKLDGKHIGFKYITDFNELGKASKLLIRKNNTIEEEKEVYDITYIKGDGDNFGAIKAAMPSITLYRKISAIFKKIITESLLNALSRVLIFLLEKNLENLSNIEKQQVLNLPIPFFIIYYSGDDFFIVIDSGFTFIFLDKFQEEIKKHLGEPTDSYKKEENENLSIFKLGISMGCLVCKNRTPIYLTLEGLEELEKIAKRKSKNMRKKYGGEICVAIQKFETFPNVNSIKNRYNDDYNVIKLTQFPLLSNELKSYIEDLRFLIKNNIEPNDLFNIIRTKNNLDNFNNINRIKLEIKFIEARNKIKKNKTAEQVAKKFEIIHSKLFKNIDNKIILRHEDFIDSLKIIYNSNELLS